MRVTSLGSGSSGNALLIEAGPAGRTKLLVDVGFNARALVERLRRIGVQPAQLGGIFLTHEHSDHVIGLSTLIKRHTIPIYTAPETLAALENMLSRGYLEPEPVETVNTSWSLAVKDEQLFTGQKLIIEETSIVVNEPVPPTGSFQASSLHLLGVPLPPGSRIVVGEIEVLSFPVSHDAAAPCGYLLSAGGCRVCIVTDSGEVTPVMLEAMQQADLLILESNYDRERLLRGPYPYLLKQRILSATGHLSNDQAADAVLRTWRPDSVRWLWLAHLSRTNNTPKLALNSMVESLTAAGANLAQIHISVLPHDKNMMWDSTQLWHNTELWEMRH